MTALSMKLLVDTSARRVLFAEANKDVVDYLFSILALPIGTAIDQAARQRADMRGGRQHRQPLRQCREARHGLP
jgi:hypothetical protein